MALYIPGVFAANAAFSRYGLRVGVLLGGGLNAVGSGLRWLGVNHTSFWLAFCGQTVCSAAQCFTLGVPPVLAAAWFGPEERATATAIGVLANQLGSAFGLLTSVLVLTGPELRPLMLWTAVISAAVFFMLLL
eukprot:SAG31_NODE_10616_length_1117_cov_1.059921_1_plen_132_part_01